ncbi:glutathione S-transferase family protein [Rheinheimera sp. UJ51]|uniref:glutathione S-transferase family protein n=1 Tax=Rheinheimera sp. UJ51 TaxID=2892446 RepID=UPI001E53582C|nr:glutathione S-transferase family protein [Rheinheimera sp. UJ51]MCC5451076.1 glutathione S-transferase family protein [Rheinheimera sp. UJ51]
MSLIVYGVPLSPFVRKLRLCLAEKALDYKLEIVLPFESPQWFADFNPLRRIPALKDGDIVLADSSVICQYLEDKYPDSLPLMGHSAEQRAKVRWLEKYADYELAPLSTFTVFQQRVLNPSKQKPVDEAAVQQALTDTLPKHFVYLEQTLGESPFFAGDSLTLADLAFTCQLINMEHGGETLDAERFPKLHSLYLRIKALPSVQHVLKGEQKILASIKVS